MKSLKEMSVWCQGIIDVYFEWHTKPLPDADKLGDDYLNLMRTKKDNVIQ